MNALFRGFGTSLAPSPYLPRFNRNVCIDPPQTAEQHRFQQIQHLEQYNQQTNRDLPGLTFRRRYPT